VRGIIYLQLSPTKNIEMKKYFYGVVVLFAAIIFTGCNSNAPKDAGIKKEGEKPKKEMTDDELNKQLYDLTKDLSTVNSIKIGAMDGIVQIAGPVTKSEWIKLRADIDKLQPKGYDTTMLDLK
jgi:hypothetical protein